MRVSRHSEICTHFPECGSPAPHHTQGNSVADVAAIQDEQSCPKYEQLNTSAAINHDYTLSFLSCTTVLLLKSE